MKNKHDFKGALDRISQDHAHEDDEYLIRLSLKIADRLQTGGRIKHLAKEGADEHFEGMHCIEYDVDDVIDYLHSHGFLHAGCLSDEWQPIETAPKDGTPVIVTYMACQSIRRLGCCAFVDLPQPKHQEVYQSQGWVELYTDELHHPTHWMPLPEPPKDIK